MGYVRLLSTLWILLFCSQDLWNLGVSAGLMDVYRKECPGTETQLSVPSGDDQNRYDQYRKMYTNCTLVQGNLEIVFIELTDAQYDFSFLETIIEVNGYVLIFGNHVEHIRLGGLKVIRGRNLFTAMESGVQGNFSLYVASNAKAGDATVGLKELQLTSLVEILNGDIFFKNNKQLCFGERTIYWANITTSATVFLPSSDPGFGNRSCSGVCHDSCTVDGQRWCWGKGPNKCQAARMCCGRRCPPKNTPSCCRSDCIGGCSQPDNCEACRNFVKEGQCVEECNKLTYIPHTQEWVRPSPPTYIYGTQCVQKCPGDMLIENETCVDVCSRGFQEDSDKKCNSCVGSSCRPISCRGTEQWLHSNNIKNFKHCNRIKGNLQIRSASFYGIKNDLKLTVDDLEMLSDVEEITGILQVDASHENLTSLSFLGKLRVIGGIGAETSNGYSLRISDTKLQSLELKSLREIKKGNVGIAGNADLCYASSVNWTRLLNPREAQTALLMRNFTPHFCEEQGRVCSSLCSSDGCWGAGDENCLLCRNFSLDGVSCVANCSSSDGFYSLKRKDGSLECRRCHDECKMGCTGDGNHQCVACKGVQHNETCLPKCPSGYYSDQNKTCQRCHSVCKECDGDGPYLLGHSQSESGGCRICQVKTAKVENSDTVRCVMNLSECDATYYKGGTAITLYDIMMETCRKCNPECDGCHGGEATDCIKCRHYNKTTSEQAKKFECASSCSYDNGYYDAGNNVCKPCHSECKLCYGPTKYNCALCKNVRIDASPQEIEALGNETMHNNSYCAERCPSGQNRHQSHNGSEEEWCAAVMESVMPLDPKSAVPLFVFLFLIIAIVVVIFAAFWRKQRLRRLKESVLANDEIPMLSVGKTRSDMSLLRHIKESELRRGNKISSGAFGTVYKGIWIPEKENIKIPVAIKVLHESSNTSQNAELLDEARIMASVCHPNCVRILAVCMTSQLMLITQLMPLGCLLDYVRKEKDNIGSRSLLLWSVQIAKGMKYLEEHGILHRNLAARNVLVQKPNQVKVADFGLAKLLSCDEEEFHSEEGKMPIRWLALESIQKRIYTPKSDVWSYGVTLWEMFSNGDTPYVDLTVPQIPQALEKGERLPQPEICTIDVYMIMIKCWMLDVDSRPTFSDLVTEFTRMAQDPGRFLVVKGDKLMRLPSGGPDTKDLVRMMSLPFDEPDLMVVSGEEYLRPSELDITGGSSNSNSSYPPCSSPLGPLNSIPEDDAYENTRTPATDDELDQKPFTKNGKLPSQYSRQGSLRYIADPCRNDPDQMSDPHHQEKKGEGAGGKTIRVDEDGYLPPQSTNTPPSYLDVVYFPSNGSTSSEDTQHLLDNKRHLGMTNMGLAADNPNYFEDDSNYLLCSDYPASDKHGPALGSGEAFNQMRPEYCNVP